MPHPNAPVDQHFELIERYAERFPLEEMLIPRSFYVDDLSGKASFQRERSSKGESLLTEELVRRDDHRFHEYACPYGYIPRPIDGEAGS